MALRLDCRRLSGKDTAHEYLKEVMGLPSHYGKNLDALYDCLSERKPLSAVLLHREEAGEYGEKILKTMEDAGARFVFDGAAAACPDYAPDTCRAALEEVLAPLGGLDFVKEGMTVAVKANLVTFLKPDAAATTHPALLQALCDILSEKGAKVIIGDSPGGLYNAPFVESVYKATGMTKLSGAELNRDFSACSVQYPEGKVLKDFDFTAWLHKADLVINFCKVKSHGMMTLSGACKNLFGTIPGTKKPEYHYRYPDPMDFAHMLVDLYEYVRPVLSIADGVVSMEGNGPTAGTPKKTGFVAASKNAHVLDLLCCGLIGLDPVRVPTLQAAKDRGLLPQEPVFFGDLEALKCPDFKHVKQTNHIRFAGNSQNIFGKAFAAFAEAALKTEPRVEKGECIGCKKCAEVCPAKAIEMKDRLPVIDKKTCIRCFCCQEFCPKGAMKVHRTLIAKVLTK